MNKNRFLALTMAGAMTLAAATPAFAVTSENGKATAETTVSITVAAPAPTNEYTMTVPAATTLNSDGTATALEGGIKIAGGTLEADKKLTVTATSDDWKMSAEGKTTTIGYGLYADEADEKATTSWEFSQAEANKEGGTNKSVYAKADATDLAAAASGTYSDTITFTAEVVNAKVAVESVSLDKAQLQIDTGLTAQLTATVLPANATDKTVTWSSDNTDVATVDQNGLITAVKEGTAKITATADGESASCDVTVEAAGVKFRYNYADYKVTEGTTWAEFFTKHNITTPNSVMNSSNGQRVADYNTKITSGSWVETL